MKKNIAIIGGGAAGIMAAIQAAKASQHQVTIYERNPKLGKKLLMTGNGKCNFSNLQMDVNCYQNKNIEFVETILHKFSEQDLLAFWSQEGMLVKDKNGYLYPFTEQAASLVEILRLKLEELKVEIVYDTKIDKISSTNDNTFLLQSGNKKIYTDCVIVATGGKAAPATGSDGNGFFIAQNFGHSITPIVPALVQLKTKEAYMKHLAGIRIESVITLTVDDNIIKEERGELQMRDFGLSGIVVFQLSRFAAYGCLQRQDVSLIVDIFPDFSESYLKNLIESYLIDYPNRKFKDFCIGMLPKKMISTVLKLCSISELALCHQITKTQVGQFIKQCKAWKFKVSEPNPFEQAQISAGGIVLEELTDNCESKLVKNLYFVGEILDVDGICGGYNLQWAWSSGAVAGRAMKHL